MCGIVGILSQKSLESDYLNSVLPLLDHRGPDDRGTWSDRHIQLGHTRLAILDLSPLGHQPMSFQGDRYWITFNGEIYNYLELRQELSQLGYRFISESDTEVLLCAYAHWGVNGLSKLRGMFAFALWDRQAKELFIARDRTGEKPLYYTFSKNAFYFASELKTLLALLPTVPELDPIAIDQYLHYQFVPEPRTLLAGVWKLPAAHYAVISPNSWELNPKRYWSLTQVTPITGNPAVLIREALSKSIGLTLRSDVPVGLALSGGIDSGAIAAITATQYQQNLNTFSIGYTGNPPCDERSQARELANRLDLPFFELELSPEELVNDFPSLIAVCDDPIADIAAYGHHAVAKLVRDHGVKVMLSGLGGDELFWGYSYLKDAVRLSQRKIEYLKDSRLPRLPRSISRRLEKLTVMPLMRRLADSPKIPSGLRSLLQSSLEIGYVSLHHPLRQVFYNLRPDFLEVLQYRQSLYTQDFTSQIPQNNPFQPFELSVSGSAEIPGVICELLFETWLVSNCLALGDRVSMSCGVETRLPFLDYQLIELVMGLRKASPDHTLGHKFWLREALADLLPETLLRRSKQGFEPPYRQWIHALLKKYQHWLEDGYLVQNKIISQSFLKFLFKRTDKINLIYRLLVLETWLRQILYS